MNPALLSLEHSASKEMNMRAVIAHSFFIERNHRPRYGWFLFICLFLFLFFTIT